MRDELYNGINIQKPWPPRIKEKEQALKKNIDRIPETICYLSNPPKMCIRDRVEGSAAVVASEAGCAVGTAAASEFAGTGRDWRPRPAMN